MNIEQTIEHVEKLYQRISGSELPRTQMSAGAVNADVNLSALVDLRMTQLLQALEDPTVQQKLMPWAPPVSIWESEEKVVICLELCGVNKQDIDITTRENVLVVSGIRQNVTPCTPGLEPRRLEIPTGTFVRMIALPHFVTAADIGSDLKNGVLEITIQKTESKSTPSSSNKKTKTSLQ